MTDRELMQQPEALRLADLIDDRHATWGDIDAVSEELRRLHEVNAELVEALKWLDNWLCEKPMPECVKRIRAAIEKATGEQR